MPHRIAGFFLLALFGCSGANTGTTPPPPPPPSPGPPALLAIVSGDGQSAAAGSVLPVVLSVLVKDAAGAAVPGVVVHFSVDSGGGSIASTSATTGANGVATAGAWSLGATAGITNVITASVTGIAAVKFHAQSSGIAARTLFATTVGAGGGTLRYTNPGDALNGLTISIPAGSYPSAVQWTVIADSTIAVTLPAGFSQVGPVLVITNGQDYADSVMTLTMPMQVGAQDAVAPFFFDPTTGTLEGVPLVARSATSATLATRHFSGDFIAIPGSGPGLSGLRGSLRLGFGTVRVVWVKIPASSLVGNFASTFRPGSDDWEFINYGDYVSPGGDCEGMSITALYYHYFFRIGSSGRPPLFHLYDQSLANQWDNVEGIRFAGSVQGDADAQYTKGFTQLAKLTDLAVANGTAAPDLTSTWLLLTLKLTGRPVLMALIAPTLGHAVIAYAARSDGSITTVSFSDPNYPGNSTREMRFVDGLLEAVSLQANVTESSSLLDKAYALGVSAEVPLNQISTRWQEFTARTSGADRYPANYHFEVYDPLTDSWSNLGTTFQTTLSTLKIRYICNDCPTKSPGAPDEQNARIWDAAGEKQLSKTGILGNLNVTTPFLAVGFARSTFAPTDSGFVDAKAFTFVHGTFSVVASNATPTVGVPVNFVNLHGGIAVPGSTWTWNFQDGTAPVVIAGDSTVNHAFTTVGTYNVLVSLRAPDSTLKGQATTGITVLPAPVVSITPVDANPGVPTTLTASSPGSFPPQAKFNWTFGDGFPGVTVTGSANVQHTWGSPEQYVVGVTIKDSANVQVLGQATSSLCVGVAWRFTSFTLSSSTAPSSGTPALNLAALANLYGYLDQVAATPADGLMYIGDGTFFPEQGVYFQVAAPGTGGAGTCWLRAGVLTEVSRVLGLGSSYSNTGTITQGNIDGAAYTSITTVPPSSGNAFNNTIQAVKSGNQLTGTVHFGMNSYGGGRTYNFVATLVGQ